MAITYLPSDYRKRFVSKKAMKNLIKDDLTINRAAFAMIADTGLVSEERLEETTLKVIKSYKDRYKENIKAGISKGDALKDALNDKKLIQQRIENSIFGQISSDIKTMYAGEWYIWLPSDAEEPDPLHQLKYGKKYRVGVGEMPGDRYGCKCGMRILVGATRLKL